MKPSDYLLENFKDAPDILQDISNWFGEKEIAEFLESYLGVDMEDSGIEEKYHSK